MGKSKKPGSQLSPSKATSTNNLGKPSLVTQACISILEDQFGYSPLNFNRGEPRARAITRYELVGRHQQPAMAREKYLVHPLPGTAPERYWAAVALDFHYADPAYDLTSAQIVVFQGDAYAEKIPFFRAEWHCSSSDLAAGHAQPHWHVYRATGTIPTAGFSEGGSVDFSAEPESFAKTVDFHFAMSSFWQTSGMGSHTHPIATPSMLASWLNGCLQYIRSELNK